MMNNIKNPLLPLDEYIPDGEPHVFDNRIYIFGSHDTEGGTRYCSEENYVCYSAPIENLGDWKYEDIIYESIQDPNYVEGAENDLYAPDVVQGNDGRYYLYYNMTGNVENTGFHDLIKVAVCDYPAGKYEYYGFVKNQDGTPYKKYLDADPAVINDGGTIRLYHGWSMSMVAAAAHVAGQENQPKESPKMPEPGSEEMKSTLKMLYQVLFHRAEEEISDLKEPLMGANTIVLADDMLTVSGDICRIVPGQFDTPKSSSFYGHAFYEAASIRKINDTYYFIYSSENSNELCYATSTFPNREFQFRGTIISNGDVGYQGRKPEDRLNMTANNHGSLEYINGQWYIFYHRQTHNSTYSRQVCAEPVTILPDGSIPQVECTTSGPNNGPLKPEGEIMAAYACNLTNGNMPHATNTIVNADISYITHGNDERYITNIKQGTMIGFKYFDFSGNYRLTLKTRGDGRGTYHIAASEWGKEEKTGAIEIQESKEWTEYSTKLELNGIHGLYLIYNGENATELLSIKLEKLI